MLTGQTNTADQLIRKNILPQGPVQQTQPKKNIFVQAVNVLKTVGDKEIDIAKKTGNAIKDITVQTGRKVIDTRNKIATALTPKSPDESPSDWRRISTSSYVGNGGMMATRKSDGSFSYMDATGGVGSIERAGVAPTKGLISRGIEAITSRFSGKGEEVASQLIDRFQPVKNFVKGKGLSSGEDPYIAVRNFAGRFGKIQNRLNDLSDILRPANKDLPDVKQLGLLDRYQELLDRGITKLPGGLTPEQVTEQTKQLTKKLGAKLPEVRNTLSKLQNYQNGILQEMRDGGIISPQSFDAIVANNEKYLPLQRVEYLAEQLDNLPVGSNSFSVPTQNLIKKIKGSTKEVADPIESIIRNTHNAVNLIERNKVFQKISALQENPEFKDLVVSTKNGIPKGFDKVSGFIDGIKQDVAVPKELADSLKGLNDSSMDIVTRTAGFMGGLLRSGATTLNAAFLPSNAIRDYQSATLVSKVGFTPLDWLKGFTSAIRHDADYKAFLESGASFSGFFEQGKKVSKTAKQLAESKTLRHAKEILNPVKLLQAVGEKIEQAPRIGVFKRSLKKGLDTTEAAFNSRNATVDFAKSGSVLKVINQWVPFLNARLQGTINTLDAVKSSPVKSVAILTAMVGLPVTATYIHNTKFHKKIWDDISQTEKDQNFIIIYGDKTDNEGNPTEVYKIPKGEVGKIFGNPLEEFLKWKDSNDPKGIERIALEAFSNVSPVDVTRNGELSAGAAIGSILPPTVKAGVETATGVNMFTGQQIIPQSLQGVSPELQYKDSTSPVAKTLGKYLKLSPLLIDNAIGTQFGGLGRQLTNPSKAGGAISGRFSGAHGGALEQKDYKNLQQAQTEVNDTKLINKRQAEDLYNQIKDLPVAQRQEYIKNKLDKNEVSQEVLTALADVVEKKVKGLSNFESSFKSQSNEAKAKFLVNKLHDLPIEERKKYFLDLYNKKLITKDVMKKIAEEIKSSTGN